ncbi:MAG: DUF5106 domain-containing protein [Tannerella sp.]|jgi:hypothetical protein|nr:DUF5106 domain-containing protein [Tannerella sp.]
MRHQLKTGIRFVFTGWIVWNLAACHSPVRNTDTAGDTPSNPCGFTPPSVPDSLMKASDRAGYFVVHYWDYFDFADTACIHLPYATEQAFADYLNILPHASGAEATQSIRHVLSRAEKERSGRMYGYFLELFDKYLYDPNSPYRNEEYYLPVATYVIDDSRSGEAEKIRMKYAREMMLKNRPGETATDFVYTLPDGKEGRLHTLKAGYTILMFYNPDCHGCGQIITALKESSLINKLQKGGTLALLLFYPDENRAAWKQHLADIPASWTNGYDRHTKVKNEELYDLRAIPSLYLLDKDKKVVLKDATFEQLEDRLKAQFPLMVY